MFKEHPETRAGVTDVLIGNLFKDFDGLFKTMSSYAAVPEPLAHGGPKASAELLTSQS